MVNRSKNKGTGFETSCVKILKAQGINAKRVALAGVNDIGDVELVGRNTFIECKSHAKYGNAKIKKFIKEIEREQATARKFVDANAKVLLCLKQNGKSDSEALVFRLRDTYINKLEFVCKIGDYKNNCNTSVSTVMLEMLK